MPIADRNIKIFIASSPQDKELLLELVKYLSILNVEISHAEAVTIGMNEEESLVNQISQADIVLPLLSSDFLNMDTAQKIERAKREATLVIPIILRYCTWIDSYYAQFTTSFPLDGKPITRVIGEGNNKATQDKYFNEVTGNLRDLLVKISSPDFKGNKITLLENEKQPDTVVDTTDKQAENLYGEKLYLLCNRYTQADNFLHRLSSLLEALSKKPHCFVLVGNYPDQHSSLIERFVHQYLNPRFRAKKMAIDNLIIPKFLMDSPTIGKLNLRRKIAEKVMPHKGQQLTAIDVLNAKVGYEALLIQHNIMSKDWNANTNEIFKWYLSEFWTVPDQNQYPQVFIFLNIIHAEEPKKKGLFSFFKKAEPDNMKKVKALAENLTMPLLVLDKLEPVSKNEVQQWFLDYAQKLELDEESIINQLYNQSQIDKQSMKKIEHTLRKAINNALKL